VYPELKRLFSHYLGLQNVQLKDLIAEASVLSGKTAASLSYMTELLLELETHIDDATTDHDKSTLERSFIFPIRGISEFSSYTYRRDANFWHEWFIADSLHLARSFQGQIPLLALDVDDVNFLKQLLKATRVEKRKLSHAAKGTAWTEGEVSPWKAYTSELRWKANSILR